MGPLTRWDQPCDPITDDVLAELVSQPGYPAAARALAANMLDIYSSDKAVAGIFKDGGRYVAAMLAIYLHVSGGLTLPSLKALCASSGLLSPGRARALLLYLRYLQFVEPAPRTGRGEPARYVPNARFIAAWRRHLAAALEAVRIAEPALDPWMDRLCAPATLDILTRIQSEGLLISARSNMDRTATLFRVFVHRHAGSQILWLILAQGDAESFPPTRTAAISVAATARRFQVSRIHVRRLLDEAEREGMIRYAPDGAILLQPLLREELQFFYAAQLLQLLAAATGALREARAGVREAA